MQTRIPFAEVQATLARILRDDGFTPERANACAQLFAETTRDGVYSHGVSRFPRFVATVRNGTVDVKAQPTLVSRFGALERWDGNQGPGNLNARACMQRALDLAREHGIGCVSLRNTNHWMRAGTYGWQAADAGLIGLCWTNTMPNLPPWGAVDARLGNNPLVLAVPREKGHIVLDMAMSQFSYGALGSYRAKNELLPVAGGFDAAGELTRDPAVIEKTQRALPIGFWKGSGLSVMLDVIAATVSLGNATCDLSRDPLRETAISQMYIVIHPGALGSGEQSSKIADAVVESLHGSQPVREGVPVRYPGEETRRIRAENTKLGLPVVEKIWQRILDGLPS